MRYNYSLSVMSAALMVLVAGASVLLAQWPPHRTDGPRTESGELDLKAPAPKASDGHPDLSGLWQPMRLNFGNLKGKGKGVVEVSGIHRLNPTIDSGLFTIDQFVL